MSYPCWAACGVSERLQMLCDLAHTTGRASGGIFIRNTSRSAVLLHSVPEHGRQEALEHRGVILRGLRRRRSDPHPSEVKIRFRVSGVWTLQPSLMRRTCGHSYSSPMLAGARRQLSRGPCRNRHCQKHRMLSLVSQEQFFGGASGQQHLVPAVYRVRRCAIPDECWDTALQVFATAGSTG